MQVRQDSIVFRTKPMSHHFDCPLQFAAVPDHSTVTDEASHAFTAELRVQPGDLLVAGSDGLWDNLHQHEVLAILRQHPGNADKVRYSPAGSSARHSCMGGTRSCQLSSRQSHMQPPALPCSKSVMLAGS